MAFSILKASLYLSYIIDNPYFILIIYSLIEDYVNINHKVF